MLTTIQITKEEDALITKLKKWLGVSSKKAAVMAGVQALMAKRVEEEKHERLRKASRAVRKSSLKANHEWAPHAHALKVWDNED